jgi:hypothetical protein
MRIAPLLCTDRGCDFTLVGSGSVSGGIKGNHFRRIERVPMAENAGIGHKSAVAAG